MHIDELYGNRILLHVFVELLLLIEIQQTKNAATESLTCAFTALPHQIDIPL